MRRLVVVPPRLTLARNPKAAGRDTPDRKLRNAVRKWIAAARARLTDAQIEEALRTGNAVLLTSDPAWAEEWAKLGDRWDERLRELMQRTGAAEFRALDLELKFELDNPHAAEYAREQTATLVERVTTETRAAIREIVGRGYVEGLHPYEQARAIRPMLGLTERDAKAARNRLQALLDDGQEPARALKGAERYEEKLLRRRAENIARTETLSAENAGQDAAWSTAADAGLLDQETTWREWIATPGSDRTCDICAPMHGQRRRMGEAFESDEGDVVDRPPLHPSCRCALGLVVE